MNLFTDGPKLVAELRLLLEYQNQKLDVQNQLLVCILEELKRGNSDNG